MKQMKQEKTDVKVVIIKEGKQCTYTVGIENLKEVENVLFKYYATGYTEQETKN